MGTLTSPASPHRRAVIASMIALGMIITLAPAASAAEPESGKIVFASDRDTDTEVYVMNPDGSDPTRLTTTPGEDFEPAFSPVFLSDDSSLVDFVHDGAALKCGQCHRVYPIKDDIPVMLIDEATVEP